MNITPIKNRLTSESNSMFSFFDRWQNIESDSGNIRKTSRAMDFAVLGDGENSRSFVYKLLFLVLELELIHTALTFTLISYCFFYSFFEEEELS